jgi:hypothetical protein
MLGSCAISHGNVSRLVSKDWDISGLWYKQSILQSGK